MSGKERRATAIASKNKVARQHKRGNEARTGNERVVGMGSLTVCTERGGIDQRRGQVLTIITGSIRGI